MFGSPRKSLRAALPALVASLALSACYSSPDKRLLQYLNSEGFGTNYTGNAQEENWVGIGDLVSYLDTYNPDVKGTSQRVDIDGTIVLPEVGAVHVAGLTRTEIEALLTKKLSAYYARTDIRVEIRAVSKDYFVFGEVLSTGVRQLQGDLTVFEAVMLAKPHDHKANLGRVRVIRADPRDPLIMTVNVAEMLRSGDSTYNIVIREKDIIVVPPTLLAQFGYFLTDLITPLTEVVAAITQAFRLPRRGFGGVNTGLF